MRTREDIESYLVRAHLPHESLGDEDTWLVRDSSWGESIVIRAAGPVIVFRVKVLELSQVKQKPELFEQLLSFNATDMLHGAYGIADGSVVLTCSLRMENLDYNEFQGTIDDFSIALTNHYEQLAVYRTAA